MARQHLSDLAIRDRFVISSMPDKGVWELARLRPNDEAVVGLPRYRRNGHGPFYQTVSSKLIVTKAYPKRGPKPK